MGDRIIITDDNDRKPSPEIIVVAPDTKPKVEKVVTEKTTVVETDKD